MANAAWISVFSKWGVPVTPIVEVPDILWPIVKEWRERTQQCLQKISKPDRYKFRAYCWKTQETTMFAAVMNLKVCNVTAFPYESTHLGKRVCYDNPNPSSINWNDGNVHRCSFVNDQADGWANCDVVGCNGAASNENSCSTTPFRYESSYMGRRVCYDNPNPSAINWNDGNVHACSFVNDQANGWANCNVVGCNGYGGTECPTAPANSGGSECTVSAAAQNKLWLMVSDAFNHGQLAKGTPKDVGAAASRQLVCQNQCDWQTWQGMTNQQYMALLSDYASYGAPPPPTNDAYYQQVKPCYQRCDGMTQHIALAHFRRSGEVYAAPWTAVWQQWNDMETAVQVLQAGKKFFACHNTWFQVEGNKVCYDNEYGSIPWGDGKVHVCTFNLAKSEGWIHNIACESALLTFEQERVTGWEAFCKATSDGYTSSELISRYYQPSGYVSPPGKPPRTITAYTPFREVWKPYQRHFANIQHQDAKVISCVYDLAWYYHHSLLERYHPDYLASLPKTNANPNFDAVRCAKGEDHYCNN